MKALFTVSDFLNAVHLYTLSAPIAVCVNGTPPQQPTPKYTLWFLGTRHLFDFARARAYLRTMLFLCPVEEIWLLLLATVAVCSVYSTLTMVMLLVFVQTRQKNCCSHRMQQARCVFGSPQHVITIVGLCRRVHKAR
jgi:hypothetical protein